jgi:hypothetical protein
MIKKLTTELETLNVVHVFKPLDHRHYPLLKLGSLRENLIEVRQESRHAQLKLSNRHLQRSFSNLCDLCFIDWLQADLFLQCHLQLHVSIILYDSRLFRDKSADTCLNLGSIFLVNTIAEIHRQPEQHLGVKHFAMQLLWT